MPAKRKKSLPARAPDVQRVVDAVLRRLKRHSILSARDEAAFARLHPEVRHCPRGTDIVRQGDEPDTSVFVLNGMVGRFHTTRRGDPQYLSLHIAGDFPDLQSLFIQE